MVCEWKVWWNINWGKKFIESYNRLFEFFLKQIKSNKQKKEKTKKLLKIFSY